MNILQRIFTDYYEEMIYTLHPRTSVIENVDKMIHCGDPSFGGAMFGCTNCGSLKFVPFRHCVFTIDENLRDFFLHDRPLLNCLFHSVTSVISRMFSKLNKSKNFTPGFIMVLHTFGRDPKSVIKYIGRYLGRPVIATSMIDKYDGKNITFHYNRHEDNKYIVETIPAMDFIARLIRHIPEKHFKMIRYSVLYARHREIDQKLYRAISREKHSIYRSFNQLACSTNL